MEWPSRWYGSISVALVLAVCGTALGADIKQCPPIDLVKQKAYFSDNVNIRSDVQTLLGVDILGRFTAALDEDRDGLADRFLLFTAEDRLPGPWSRLVEHANVRSTNGSILIESADGEVKIDLAVNGADPSKSSLQAEKLPGTALVVHNGRESVGYSTLHSKEVPVAMSSLSHSVIESWPMSFRSDLMQPQTGTHPCSNCLTVECDSGGCNSPTCGVNCSFSPTCSVGCSGNTFACCRCSIMQGQSGCRCIPCIAGPP